MSIKSMLRELSGITCGMDNSLRKQGERKSGIGRGRSHIAPESPLPSVSSEPKFTQQSQWSNLPSELLLDIIRRVESSETSWPARRDVVACAAVCRSWREVTKEVVRTPEQCGLITFPISLKQPGPRDNPIQCFIRRERGSSTFRLYLGLSPALSGNASKLLLAAKKVRRATKTDFLISFASDDFSRVNENYVGRLRSNFLGTKFIIYDSQATFNSLISSRGQLHDPPKKALPRSFLRNYNVASISYELNVLRTRGPRRMNCTMHSIPVSALQDGGIAPTPDTFGYFCEGEPSCTSCIKGNNKESNSNIVAEESESCHNTSNPLVLRNKSPRWHEQLQCWCLNFKGRVTVASVKNFQLVAAIEPSEALPVEELDKVILQFGKIGKDIFTMDYRYPLSAFQAFAICLSSFDTKPACE
ncbi:OLC1v1018001C1 [Oldenlandia corymbosa var. corymbosa]|uniref:Tubby-like F-box protein n=1 Tax=Oldenlandia corymbosa var. corymbosa TaxID=529605 RepID=A0AAV1EAN9_OLDCO|nr:OLC1v1018001C1 [Oldenlandia corymbosa var. corymbosa]